MPIIEYHKYDNTSFRVKATNKNHVRFLRDIGAIYSETADGWLVDRGSETQLKGYNEHAVKRRESSIHRESSDHSDISSVGLSSSEGEEEEEEKPHKKFTGTFIVGWKPEHDNDEYNKNERKSIKSRYECYESSDEESSSSS